MPVLAAMALTVIVALLPFPSEIYQLIHRRLDLFRVKCAFYLHNRANRLRSYHSKIPIFKDNRKIIGIIDNYVTLMRGNMIATVEYIVTIRDL